MINVPTNYHYQTTDGRAVLILPKQKTIGDKKIYIGLIEGAQAYHHWTQDGVLFGAVNKDLNLKETE